MILNVSKYRLEINIHKCVNRLSCGNLRELHTRFNEILFKDKSFLKGLELEAGDLYLDSTCVGAKRKSKDVFLKMKTLEEVIHRHSVNHYHKFSSHWSQELYIEGRAKVILNRLGKTIDIMPKVIFQAHERIIGERQIKQANKSLSLYQDDVHMVKRRKSEAHNEFGNQLLIGEQANGFTVDFHFEQEKLSNNSGLN